MQFPLFGERVSDLALELTDPEVDEKRRIEAGDELIRDIESGHGTFADLAALTDSLALGMKMLKTQKRIPARTGDFVFTDLPMTRLSTVFTVLGERLDSMADRCRTQTERDHVQAFRTMHGIDDFRGNLFVDIKNHDLNAMAKFTEKISENADNLREADDGLNTGQNTLLDIPLAILAQFYLAAGERLDQLTEYSLPPLY